MHVCGEAKDGKEAIEKVKALNPDLFGSISEWARIRPESAKTQKEADPHVRS